MQCNASIVRIITIKTEVSLQRLYYASKKFSKVKNNNKTDKQTVKCTKGNKKRMDVHLQSLCASNNLRKLGLSL